MAVVIPSNLALCVDEKADRLTTEAVSEFVGRIRREWERQGKLSSSGRTFAPEKGLDDIAQVICDKLQYEALTADDASAIMLRFEELCRRLRIYPYRELRPYETLRPYLMRQLILELVENHKVLTENDHASISIKSIIAFTCYHGATAKDIMNDYPGLKTTPGYFRNAVRSSPRDPKTYLKKAINREISPYRSRKGRKIPSAVAQPVLD